VPAGAERHAHQDAQHAAVHAGPAGRTSTLRRRRPAAAAPRRRRTGTARSTASPDRAST
jgi:hypothetical protein